MKRKEIFWLIATFGISIIICLVFLGLNCFSSSTTDINVHDTYFIVEKNELSLLIIKLTFFFVYLVRILKRKFKNLTANLIFMIANFFMNISVVGLFSLIKSFARSTGVIENNMEKNSMLDSGSTEYIILWLIFLMFQIFLLISLGYTGFKTGLNFEKNG
ncbi:hypothetical protein ACFQZJ_12225 [Maribacter chungangensis]|uniref:Uncharacterized protein n=1 Tax=Maribacter chungangensis TaxID=1069117 RepID=A0ABW3B6D2_9FLAO